MSALLNMENKRLCLKDHRLNFELVRREARTGWSYKKRPTSQHLFLS